MKLIPKDAVLAEIDKRQRMLDLDNPLGRGGMVELQVLKDKLNLLKVKEANLETEIERVRKHHYVNDDFDKVEIDGRTITNIAKHFFELGIKVTQKGE